jgi:hypothetical protein
MPSDVAGVVTHTSTAACCAVCFVGTRYWRWWGAERNVRGNGLVSVLHGWESGLDASPLYDAAYGLKSPVGPVTQKLYLEL